MRESDSALFTRSVPFYLHGVEVLCTFLRVLYSFKYRATCPLPATDDLLVVSVAIIALASMLFMSASVTNASTPDKAPQKTKDNDIQLMSYVSTILFVFGLNLSKIPLVLWLKRLKLSAVFKIGSIAAGCTTLACLLAMTTSVIFQCQLPKPWDIQSGQCTSSYSLWTTMIAIDIVLDASLSVLPTVAIMSLGVPQRCESRAAFILSLRTLLIIPSLIRLVHLQQPTADTYHFLLENRPYAIATQCQITIATMLSCTLALPYLADLAERPSTETLLKLTKHWSGSSYGSDIANDYFASAPAPIIRAPLPAIQACMVTPVHSRQGSAVSVLSSSGKAKAPLRPPPPSEHQRPDMKTFVRRPTVLRPPPVTMLYGGLEEQQPGKVTVVGRSSVGAVRTSKHVKFEV
ncbi:CFEM domain-containing protein [Stagonosporopsis vannaccii]|nr:CFEM domain-containing protein [Stagonosporopsis vannaccii]